MPTKDRQRAKGRRESGTFYALPTAILASESFRQLSNKACKLFLDLLTQIRMKPGGPDNNGDLCITLSVMKQRGWKSKQQLEEARDELEHYGFIVLTRQGGKRIPNLYGFTWWAINECGGKLEPPYNQGTEVAPGGWKEPKPPFVPKRKKSNRSAPPSEDVTKAPLPPGEGSGARGDERLRKKSLPRI